MHVTLRYRSPKLTDSLPRDLSNPFSSHFRTYFPRPLPNKTWHGYLISCDISPRGAPFLWMAYLNHADHHIYTSLCITSSPGLCQKALMSLFRTKDKLNGPFFYPTPDWDFWTFSLLLEWNSCRYVLLWGHGISRRIEKNCLTCPGACKKNDVLRSPIVI